MEFNKKENSLDPVCSNEICIFEDMFIRGTALSKTMKNLKEPMWNPYAISNDFPWGTISYIFIFLFVIFVSFFLISVTEDLTEPAERGEVYLSPWLQCTQLVHDGWKGKVVGIAEEWPFSDSMDVRWSSSFLIGQPARREQDQKRGWMITTKEPTPVPNFCQPGPLTLNIQYLLHTVAPTVGTHEPVGNILHPYHDTQCQNHHVYVTWLHPHMTFLFCFVF